MDKMEHIAAELADNEMHVNISRTAGYSLHILLPSDLLGEEWFKSNDAANIPVGVDAAIKKLVDEVIKWRVGYDIRASNPPRP